LAIPARRAVTRTVRVRCPRSSPRCSMSAPVAELVADRSFLAEKTKLTRRRLDALLVLVNKFRRRTSRRPLRSTSELLDYVRT
jgi:hypothetical protein